LENVVKIKSKLNGEVSNVRADIAREMVKLGVAELLEPDTGSDGIVAPNGEPPYRLPKPGDTPNPSPHFFVGVHEGRYVSIFLKIGNVERRYSGDPRYIHNRKDHAGREFCSSLGFPVPVEIQKEYLKAWKHGSHEPMAPGVNIANLQATALFSTDPVTGRVTELSNAAMKAECEAKNAILRANDEAFVGDSLSHNDAAIVAEAELVIKAQKKRAGIKEKQDEQDGVESED
jgi:hypothetical protein